MVEVTKQDIIEGLRRLGLEPGAIILVHSSLKSFGHVEGGATTVIEALKETVTRQGLVVMPTHTYSLKNREGAEPYDPRTTRSETGLIPLVFWQQADVLRSLHPTHSDAAWGDRAAELLADHETRGPIARDSPLDRAARWGGHVLQLGTRHTTNTSLHLAEVLANVPYLHVPYRRRWGTVALVRAPDGRAREIQLPVGHRPGCSGGFDAIEPLLEAHGLTRETRIGESRARLTRTLDMLRLAVETLEKDAAFLLCRRPDCQYCTEARKVVVESRS